MKPYQKTPTLSTNIYAANDAVTDLEYIILGESGWIERIVIKDLAAIAAPLTIHFFKGVLANPAAANAAFALDDTDLLQWIDSVDFSTYTNLNGVATNKVSVQRELSIPFSLERSSANDYRLYYQVTTTGTPTYTANGLVFDFLILNDGDL